MGFALKEETQQFTYGDYLNWDDKERWEIIDGHPYNMTPAPSTNHQLVSTALVGQLSRHLENNSCRIIAAPFDVRLPMFNQKEEEITNVVQPDISIICDPSKLDRKGSLGPPDLIMEIISPSSTAKDKKEKFALYELAGVKEYWLVYPDNKIVEVFSLDDSGRYGRPRIYGESDSIPLTAVKGITVNLKPIFAHILA
ncbi:MAG: Uma2 family endonuclease [bacterium]|nr:Uma2 family endonuclease [bacterium]